MISGNKNTEYEILNRLDDKSLVNYCQTNKKSKQVCSDDNFWLSRVVHKFPYIDPEILRNYKKDRSWAKYYIDDLRVFLNQVKKDNPNELLLKSSEQGRLDHVAIALNNGANIDHQDYNGWTALIWATINGHLEIIKFLIKEGADIDLQDRHGNTALIFAARYSYGRLDVVKYLVEKGANINQQNNDGKTALMWASSGVYLSIVKFLVEKGADINHKDIDGQSVLNWAGYNINSDTVKYLEEKGAI